MIIFVGTNTKVFFEMKKYLFVFILSLLSLSTFAQQAVGPLTVFPKVGMNLATFRGEAEAKVRVGFVGGVEVDYRATELLGVSFEALYSQQGAKADRVVQGSLATVIFKFDYINFPILANIYPVPGLALKFGIQPGFNVLAKVDGTYKGVSVSVNVSEASVNVKSFDLAVPVGLSYQIKNIVLDARYNIGITRVVDIQFTVGYRFGR